MKGSPKGPLVSIVIPAYNAGDFLREAIDSVLSQTYQNIELIVLDDGSTDQTRDVLSSYPQGSFYWESHPNMGQAATLNKGWAMAKGEVLGYLSADDALLPNAVKESVSCLQRDDAIVMAYCDYEQMNEASERVQIVRLPDFSYRNMVIECDCPPGPGAFWKRSAFEKSGGWNPKLRQVPDYDFWLRLGLYGSFHHIDKVLARFRVHAGSQTCGVGNAAKSEEIVTVMKQYFQRHDIPQGVRTGRDQALANAHIFAASLHLKAGRYLNASRHIREAIGLTPASLFYPRNFRRLAGGLWFHL